MARRSRRNHSPAFKAKVALFAIRGELTMAELSKKFDIHANLITQWKTQLLQNATSAFDGSSVKTEEVDVEKLHAKIGQLTLDVIAGRKVTRLGSKVPVEKGPSRPNQLWVTLSSVGIGGRLTPAFRRSFRR